MAELHGRILRFPHRYGLALAAYGLVFLAFTAPVRADGGPTIDDLLRHAEALRGEDAGAREQAVRYLSTLPEEAMPAIAERLRQTRQQLVPEEDGYDALRFFRHATGSLRADDMVDIVPGILPVLEERRTPVVGRTAERLLYMRSLEAIGTLESQRMIGDILAMTPRMWRWERRRLVERHGVRLLPGLIVLRNHAESPVRVWARWGIEELGMEQPAVALQQDDPMLVAQILEAYGEARDMDSMTVVISYVGHPAAPIRRAARGAMEDFAHNGIWQLREAMRNQLGRDADLAWTWERTARELYEGLDEARLAPLEALLNEGLEAAEAGDVATATAKLDEVLRAAPVHPRRGAIARSYLALAEASGSEADTAERFIRRAALLAPNDADVRVALLALEAEDDLARGVLDAEAWRVAARAGNPRAREVVADLLDEELPELPEGEAESGTESELPWDALVALLLLVGLGYLGWRSRERLRGMNTSRLARVLRRSGAPAKLRRLGRRVAGMVPRRFAERLKRPARALAQLVAKQRTREEPEAERSCADSGPKWVIPLRHRLLSMGFVRRLALFRRLIRGQKPPPRPTISAKEVVRRRYGKKPEAKAPSKRPPARVLPKVEPRVVHVVPPRPATEPPADERALGESEARTGLDSLLLGGVPARPVEPDATFRSPPPVHVDDHHPEPPRPAAPDLASLVLAASNEERAERSSPGTIEAPDLESFVESLDDIDAGDTLAEPPSLDHDFVADFDPSDTLRE